MSIPDWATTVSGAIALLAALWAAHRFITKSLIKEYLSELKPNGGSSIKDKVNDIDKKVNKLESRIDQIYLLLVDRK
jgi:uncharacterized protein Yka (UPF0111/DUF47 family)